MGFGKDGKGAILHEQVATTLSTLANVAAIKAGANLVLGDDFRVIKVEWVATMDGLTAGEGPIDFGFADNALSVAQIAEVLVLDGPLDRNDHDGNEKAMRPVWVLETFVSDSDGPGGPAALPQREKTLRWTFSNPEGWTWFAFNRSGGTLTTGAVIKVLAKYFGVWVT